MKKIIFLLIMTLLFTNCSKNDKQIIMITEAGFAPYEYYENGEIVGVDIAIAQEIAKELGKELIVKDVSFDFLINEIKSGKADFAAAGISITTERQKEVDFSIEYTISNQVVVVNKNSSINNFSDIANKKISVQLGTVADMYANEKYPNATIITQKKYLASAEDVKSGKADCIIMDELPAQELVKANPELKILDGILFKDSYGMIVKKGNKELLETINKVLQRLIDENKIEEYILEYSK